ncbi:MAG: flagellar hook-length control protein FliK [Anaerobacillus sp.]
MKTTLQPLQQNAPAQSVKGKVDSESTGFAQILTGASTQVLSSKQTSGRGNQPKEERLEDETNSTSEEDVKNEKKPVNVEMLLSPFFPAQQLHSFVSGQEKASASSGQHVVKAAGMNLMSNAHSDASDESMIDKPSSNRAQVTVEGGTLTKKEQTVLLAFLKENGVDLTKSSEKNVQVLIEQTVEDKNVIKRIKVDHQNQPDMIELLNKKGLISFSGLTKNASSDSEKTAKEANVQDDQVNLDSPISGDNTDLAEEKKTAQQPVKTDQNAAPDIEKNVGVPQLDPVENQENPTEPNSGEEGTQAVKHTSGEMQSQSPSGSTTTPVPVRHFSSELSEMIPERMQMMKNGDESHIRIKLSPENLGQLDIRLTTADGKVTAHIVTATSAAKDMIESQLHQLRHSLVQQGVQLDKVEVMQQPQPASQNSFMQDGRSQQGQQFEQGKQRQRKGEYELEENPHITKEVEEGTPGGINYAV